MNGFRILEFWKMMVYNLCIFFKTASVWIPAIVFHGIFVASQALQLLFFMAAG